jgi:predicted DNA-binding protein (UPF0251 family)
MIDAPPPVRGFKPVGQKGWQSEPLLLNWEGYESIRLVLHEGLSQEEAAELMQVSRPTLTRVFNKALKTLARALTEGRPFLIEGGVYEVSGPHGRCGNCNRRMRDFTKHHCHHTITEQEHTDIKP